jgi:hypothetical protein
MTRHLDPKTLFAASERHDSGGALPARDRPLSCLDGSLVINADGTVSKASPEQQRIARAARIARVAEQLCSVGAHPAPALRRVTADALSA